MSGTTIVLGHLAGREVAARVADGVLDDLLVAPADGAPAPGTIFRARAGRPMKGQGGLFLNLPDGRAYLRGGREIASGSALLVQVTGYAEPGKAVPVTTRLAIRGRYAIATPGAPGVNVSREIRDDGARAALSEIAAEVSGGLPDGCGLILRSLAAEADEGEVRDGTAEAVATARSLDGAASGPPALVLPGPGPHRAAWIDWGFADAVVQGAGAFGEADLIDAIAAGLATEQPLAGGAAMVVEATRALVAVDVNTGGDASPAAGLKVNLAAVAALPRILRLRGLGGQVVVDAAPMSKGDRSRVEAALVRALKSDPVPTTIAGWTPLGHMELQRRRLRAPFDGPLE